MFIVVSGENFSVAEESKRNQQASLYFRHVCTNSIYVSPRAITVERTSLRALCF